MKTGRCMNCGDVATSAVVMDNLPYKNWTVLCDWHIDEHFNTEREIQEHEMRNFGGYYGMPMSHVVPLIEVPEEGEFEECGALELTGQPTDKGVSDGTV